MASNGIENWPSFTEEESAAVSRVLMSNRVNYWTGQECHEFEKEFAEWTGVKYAIAVANGTLALDLALHGLGIGRGDEVIVTPRTYIASVSAVVNCGATPVFADVDSNSGNITADSIAAKLTSRTKAIIPVHLAGWPCDMDAILVLAETHNLKVIEDCAQAHGALYKGKSVGSLGHVGAWSFCQEKIMTTGGEGGMVTTNDKALWTRMWSYKDHGKEWSTVFEKQHPFGYRWLHESFGTNFRMLEMQAAIGRIQLKRMPDWTARRNANANRINEALAPFAAVRVPPFRFKDSDTDAGDARCVNARYKLYAYARPENLAAGWSRDRILITLSELGVPCSEGSCAEVYRERAFDGTSLAPTERLPTARALGETSLMFMVHPTLSEESIKRTCDSIREVLGVASLPQHQRSVGSQQVV